MAIQIDRAVCLHIPKTGGTFVRNYLQEAGMDHGVEKLLEKAHVHGQDLRDRLGQTEDLIFCFVRHPLTWYRSYWESKQRISDRSGGWLDEQVDLPWHQFIGRIITDRPGYLTGFFNGYTEICRFVGKQENLRHDLDTVLKYLRIPYDRDLLFSKPSENVIPSDKKYTLAEIRAIMQSEEKIIKMYDYDYIPIDVIGWNG